MVHLYCGVLIYKQKTNNMIKYFLKGTDQEVKVGNKIRISVPTKTPYGEGTCEVEILVTQASLEQLCRDDFVEQKSITPKRVTLSQLPNVVEYKPFLRRLARNMGEASIKEALVFLDILGDISPYSRNCLLIELMAEEMNRDKKRDSCVYMINLGNEDNEACIKRLHTCDVPVFFSMEDACKALKLITPFTKCHAGK